MKGRAQERKKRINVYKAAVGKAGRIYEEERGVEEGGGGEMKNKGRDGEESFFFQLSKSLQLILYT